MKKILPFLLVPILSFGQIQIGLDIDGEASNDYSGNSVSLSNDGSILAIGASENDGNGFDSGQVRIYKNISGTWAQIGGDINGTSADDQSGCSVSLSGDGNIVAIGAKLNDGNGSNSGQVRVYRNISGVWTQIGADIYGEALNDQNGCSVSLSDDGTIVAIGAKFNDGNGSNSGSVHIYKNISGSWTQLGTDIDGEAANDSSGDIQSISLSGDGSVLAIGSPYNGGNGSNSGSVRVYKNMAGIWMQVGTDIDGEAANDYSSSVSLSSDGNIVAIGASENTGNGLKSGSVRIYKNISGNWIQIGADIDGEAVNNLSGTSVSLSDDGTIVAIGAPINSGNGDGSGSVRVYKNIADNWIKIGTDIDGEASGDRSGASISISTDGSKIAVGATDNDGNGIYSGHVRVYDLSTFLNLNSIELASFSIYPNPSSDNVNISLQENQTLEKVNIYNTLGQLVKTEKSNTISVSSLSHGTYYFEIITDKGKGSKTVLVK